MFSSLCPLFCVMHTEHFRRLSNAILTSIPSPKYRPVLEIIVNEACVYNFNIPFLRQSLILNTFVRFKPPRNKTESGNGGSEF